MVSLGARLRRGFLGAANCDKLVLDLRRCFAVTPVPTFPPSPGDIDRYTPSSP